MLKHLISLEKYSYNLCGKIALDRKIISYTQLLEALDHQHQFPQKKLGEVLQELQYTDEDTWNEVLMYQSIFQQRSPVNWAHIPNTVIKGTVALNGKLGKADWQQLQKIDISGGQKLQDVLMRLHLVTNNHIKKFLQRLEIKQFFCSACKRDYDLFEYHSQEPVVCPVCRDNDLQGFELPPTIVIEQQQSVAEIEKKEREDTIVAHEDVKPQHHDDEQKVVSISVVKLEDMHEDTQENTKLQRVDDVYEVEEIVENRVKATPIAALPPKKTPSKTIFAVAVVWTIITVVYFSVPKVSVQRTKSKVIDLALEKEEPVKQPTPVVKKKNKNIQQEKHVFQYINNKVFVKNLATANIEKYAEQLQYLQKQNPQTKYLADYKNFHGRLIFYQLWLNASAGKNSTDDLNLLERAQTLLQQAQQLYSSSNNSIFHLRVMPWMPEAKRYRVKPWDRKFPTIDFNSLIDAQQDIESLLKEMRFFKEKYYAKK